jgi:Icc-related predicted phosphoesterase
MIFLYSTDLHGSEQKFNDILSFAIEHQINLIHLGSDLLPKGSDILSIQKKFINGFLKTWYEKCYKNGIEVLAFFGNDDLYSRKKYFKKFATLLDEQPREIEGYSFKAYPYVCDYPFALKTACKLDYRTWQKPYVDYGVDVDEKGIVRIEDLDEYFSQKSTIEEDLKKISVLSTKEIIACHMPPWSVDLDVCGRMLLNGGFDHIKRVGSKSIFDWILKEQPLICLCGHIHESYNVTNVWKTHIGKTLVVQPGQMFKTRFIVFEVEELLIKTHHIEV